MKDEGKRRDEFFLREALKEGMKAGRRGEVPVGAVLVSHDRIIARGHNLNVRVNDPTAHAEIVALRKGAAKLKNYRLGGTRLYVTVEPCPMCAGALVWARVSEVIFGAYDKKAGACGSVANIARNKVFNHCVKVTGGMLEKECRSLMQDFFKRKRTKPLRAQKKHSF